MSDEKPMVTQHALLAMQVCVPTKWKDADVVRFANGENPAGTTNGWMVRREKPVRAKCEQRKGFVHVVLEC